MENDEVFSKMYSKLLNLIAKVNEKLVDKIYDIVNNLPRPLKTNIEFEETCSLDAIDKHIDLRMYGDMMELKIVRYKKYLATSIFLYPYYEDEVLEKEQQVGDHYMLLGSLNVTNTEEDVNMEFYYKEKDGKYDLKGMNIPNNGKEIDISVYLDRDGDDYYLNSVYSFNNIELHSKTLPITIDEILEHVLSFEDLEDGCDEDIDDLEFIDKEDDFNNDIC